MCPELFRGAWKGLWKKAFKAAAVGNLVSLLLLLLCAWMVWRGTVPESVMRDLALGAVLLGAAAAGAMTAAGEGGALLCGAMGGGAYLLVITVIGLYREQGAFFDLDYLRFVVCSGAGSVFGGIISTGKKNKRRKFRGRKYTNSNRL